MYKITVVLVDEDAAFTKQLKVNLEASGIFLVVGCARDGLEAWNMILRHKPNLVVLDVMLSKLDGLSLIERVKLKNNLRKTGIIVLSSISKKCMLNKALAVGTDYYIVKPFDLTALMARMKQIHTIVQGEQYESICGSFIENVEQRKEVKLEYEVTNLIHEMGIPANIKGYDFLRDAIIMSVNNKQVLTSVTKLLYPSVAHLHETTGTSVERAIRHAIEVAWSRGKTETLDALFGYTIKKEKGKPTNSEFVSMVADMIRMKYRD